MAAGLLGKTDIYHEYASQLEIQNLRESGHNLGSHTYSHVSVRTLNKSKLLFEILHNDITLEQLSGESRINHFSYPFGKISFRAKRLLKPRFATMRGIRAGINAGRIDFAELRAIPIYGRSWPDSDILYYISKVVEAKGWLIFYTHDICNTPSLWGTTPAFFKRLVMATLDSEAEIMNVDRAFNKISNSLRV